jgi:hypothetical protein
MELYYICETICEEMSVVHNMSHYSNFGARRGWETHIGDAGLTITSFDRLDLPKYTSFFLVIAKFKTKL